MRKVRFQGCILRTRAA